MSVVAQSQHLNTQFLLFNKSFSFFFYHQVLRKILYLPKPPNEGKICVILDLMRMIKKQEIQLFNDRRIRTIWDDKEEKWYFSVVDVIEALTETDRPRNLRQS